MINTDRLIQNLFTTRALRVCPKDRPFWYTSGTIGTYYINTHFLYGSEEKATHLLEMIDNLVKDHEKCPQAVLKQARENYRNDRIYADVIDLMHAYIKTVIGEGSFEYISGGERRDWFFSPILADMLKKPHITIFKDLSCVITDKDKTQPANKIRGAKVLHIADLITEASSYERAWAPAISALGGHIAHSLVVVDRKQGGAEKLNALGIHHHAIIGIDEGLFDRARVLGIIDSEQHQMIAMYLRDPKGAMREFLLSHPSFIRESLQAGGKAAERAALCLEKDYYGIENQIKTRDERP